MSNQLAFNGTQLSTLNRNNQVWLSSSELAKALQYSDSRSISKIYNTHSDEFTACMTDVTESITSGNYITKTRFFSLRGCHLIAMFSRTKIAKEFRKWVLDILDKEIEKPSLPSKKSKEITRRYLVEVNIIDFLTKGKIQLLGQCHDFNALITNVARELGYRINSMSVDNDGLKATLNKQ